jgi:tellurite methyltransferase
MPVLPVNFSYALDYEAITGEAVEESDQLWDSYYRSKTRAKQEVPIPFVKEVSRRWRKGGRVLVPGMGEGRNALFLAKMGFDVTGIDISEIAVHRAQSLAKIQKLNLKAVIADVLEYPLEREFFDAVVLSLFQLREYFPKIKNALKPKGQLLAYLQLQAPQKLGKQVGDEPYDFAVQEGEIESLFVGWKTVVRRIEKVEDVRYLSLVVEKP